MRRFLQWMILGTPVGICIKCGEARALRMMHIVDIRYINHPHSPGRKREIYCTQCKPEHSLIICDWLADTSRRYKRDQKWIEVK